MARQYSSIPSQIVGTPGPTVTPSSTISRCRNAVSALRPGSTSLAPNIGPKNGIAQPLQWKNPGTPRIASSAHNPQPLPPPVESAFRTVPRWLYSAPFGAPVVPEVKHSSAAVRSPKWGQTNAGSPASIKSS